MSRYAFVACHCGIAILCCTHLLVGLLHERCGSLLDCRSPRLRHRCQCAGRCPSSTCFRNWSCTCAMRAGLCKRGTGMVFIELLAKPALCVLGTRDTYIPFHAGHGRRNRSFRVHGLAGHYGDLHGQRPSLMNTAMLLTGGVPMLSVDMSSRAAMDLWTDAQCVVQVSVVGASQRCRRAGAMASLVRAVIRRSGPCSTVKEVCAPDVINHTCTSHQQGYLTWFSRTWTLSQTADFPTRAPLPSSSTPVTPAYSPGLYQLLLVMGSPLSMWHTTIPQSPNVYSCHTDATCSRHSPTQHQLAVSWRHRIACRWARLGHNLQLLQAPCWLRGAAVRSHHVIQLNILHHCDPRSIELAMSDQMHATQVPSQAGVLNKCRAHVRLLQVPWPSWGHQCLSRRQLRRQS